MFDLSCQVLEGLGLEFASGQLRAPGFVVGTWRAWESLLRVAIQSAFPGSVQPHQRHLLGRRGNQDLWVNPDFTLRLSQSDPVIVDAKYKGRSGTTTSVQLSDIYEINAFMEAAEATVGFLIYPSVSDLDASQSRVVENDRFCLAGMRTVIALEVDVRGIATRHGFRSIYLQIQKALASRIDSLVPQAQAESAVVS
jgi:hypothetical protein